jgi:hypothetical protein
MDEFELLLTSLGEVTTKEIHKNENSMGMKKLKKDANIGGKIAGNTRKEIEKKLGRSIVTSKNFLPSKKIHKKLKN